MNMIPPKIYDLQVTAMCAWEHLLSKGDDMERYGGYGNARGICANLAPAIIHGYRTANVDGCRLDWEFTPWFMENCISWGPTGIPDLVPDWLDQCRLVDFSSPTEEIFH